MVNFKKWLKIYEANFPVPITLYGQQVGSDEEFDAVADAWEKKHRGYTDDQIASIKKAVDRDDFGYDPDEFWLPHQDPMFNDVSTLLKKVLPDDEMRQQLYNAINRNPIALRMFKKLFHPDVTKDEVQDVVRSMVDMGVYIPSETPQNMDQKTWVGSLPPVEPKPPMDPQKTNIEPIQVNFDPKKQQRKWGAK